MEESKVLENENVENENMELVETDTTEVETYEPEEGSFKGLALAGAIAAGVTALGAYAFRKLKDKKAGKPRVKKRLRWVEVDENDIIDVEVDETKNDENVEETA